MKTSDVPRWQELAAAAALGALDTREREEVRELPARERRAFDSLHEELELTAGELAALSFATDSTEVPAAVHARLSRLQLASRAHVQTAPTPVGAVRTRPWSWLLVAAALAVAALVWDRVPGGRLATAPVVAKHVLDAPQARTALLRQEGVQRIDWKATTDRDASGATGDVVWHAALQRGYMRIAGLRPNDPTQAQYQLWIFDASRDEKYPVDGGVFDVTRDGEVIVPITARLHVSQPKLFAITVEPPGGVVVSKRERIVLTAAAGT